MGFQTTTGISGAALGFFRINARISVRGRRGVPLAPDALFSRLTKEKLYLKWEKEFVLGLMTHP